MVRWSNVPGAQAYDLLLGVSSLKCGKVAVDLDAEKITLHTSSGPRSVPINVYHGGVNPVDLSVP